MEWFLNGNLKCSSHSIGLMVNEMNEMSLNGTFRFYPIDGIRFAASTPTPNSSPPHPKATSLCISEYVYRCTELYDQIKLNIRIHIHVIFRYTSQHAFISS